MLSKDGSRTKVVSYHLNPINDQIVGDPEIIAKVNEFKNFINETILKPMNTSFTKPVAKATRTLIREYHDPVLGQLVSRAFQKATQTDIGICPNGMIRDDIKIGKTGIQSFSDIFRIMPLGLGETDDAIGYPMIKFHLNGKELKQMLEVLLQSYNLKGVGYSFQLAGAKVVYNPFRMVLDQIVEAYWEKADGSTEMIEFNNTKRLYSIGTLSYVGKFFWFIPKISMGLFSLTPRNAQGHPISELIDSVVKADVQSKVPGEYKAWKALLDYIQTLPRDPETKLPLLPSSAKSAWIERASFAPRELFKNATWIQWGAFVVFGLVVPLLILLIFWVPIHRKFSRSRTRIGGKG